MHHPQAEKWGDASLSSPTDRRPCCVELPNPTFWQTKTCHHSNGNKLHKVQESAASAVGIKQARVKVQHKFHHLQCA